MKRIVALIAFFALLPAAADVITDLRPHIREEAKAKDVDPVLLEAIMRHESAHGQSKAAKNKNNLAGIKAGRRLKTYNSKEDSVSHLAEVLVKYKKKGVVSVNGLSRRYCASSSKTWARHINRYMAAIRNGTYGTYEEKLPDGANQKKSGGIFSQTTPEPQQDVPLEKAE